MSTNPRVATMLAAEIWWDPIANFSAAKFRMRNRGHLLLSRPRKNRLSWFSFFISANQLRSVLLSVVSGGGFQHWLLFFLFSASRFLAAHKKLHSFKPSKRQMAQCPAAMAPLRQPSVAGVAGFRSRCPYRQAGRDRNLLAQSLLAYLHPVTLGYRSSLPRRG